MTTRETIRHFVTTNFYVAGDGLTDEASLIDSGVVDSTGVIEVVTFIENSFGVAIDDAEMVPDNLDSIARIAAFIERKRGEAA